ncbi:NADPH-dependent oxidoreductase [Anthocerotibacter panamensis]|uniref:NADPH-dependent oxidoreductase n=1 Tax=Anthocerotibacter panamensis TaxID=2857077 RepID=UPI001C4022B3|nr:NADPH-dependent oxidoreductase [Anthocerotibacter panamensis]
MTDLTSLLQERYGFAEALVADPGWNACLETLLSHRSIRSYLSRSLPPNTLELLVAAAQSAATSSNLQTWSVVAIEDSARKEQLSHLAGDQAQIRQCPLFLVWLADLARLSAVAQRQQLPCAGLEYLELFVTALIDCALAAQNAVVAAESLGLGTVYIGAMRNHPVQVAAQLGLPPKVFAVFGLCVGYSDPAHPAAIKPRLPQTAVLHREVYGQAADPQAVATYDERMAAFYQQQHMTVNGSWSHHSVRRVAGAAALGGRDQLRILLQQLGFPLE